MTHADPNPTRTITLVLPESDWKALRTAEPDAVGWLQARIQDRLASGSPAPAGAAGRALPWTEFDEY